MDFTFWYILVGILLVGIALGASTLRPLPLTTSMLYFGVGIVLGPQVFQRIDIDPIESAPLLERICELAVLVSLFAAGLKLSTPLRDRRWWPPVLLAFVSMTITVGLITVIGVVLLGLPLGAAVLLGAILSPTDPVLASDVQVEHPWDRDRLRFSLTGEAGMNDGTAFPFVMLGLGLLGLHDLGPGLWRWVAIDLVWAVCGGVAIGAGMGMLVGKLVVFLRRRQREALALDDYLSLGLMATSYGVALWAHTYGFLAVFAAGLALRRVESAADGEVAAPPAVQGAAAGEHEAIDPEKVPALMAQAVLGFNEQLERILEVAVVLVIGGMLRPAYAAVEAVWFVPLAMLVVRPAAVLPGLWGSGLRPLQRGLICWFGIRGVGSLYYLAYALSHGLEGEPARLLTALTLTIISASIVLHGVSVTPLMRVYQRLGQRAAGG